MSLRGFPGEAGVDSSSLWRQGHWWQRPQGILIGVSSPGGPHFSTNTWAHPTACKLQCWNAPGQTTRRIGTQTHPLAKRLPKVVLRSQPPLNTLLDMALLTRGNPTPPTTGQAPAPPTRKPAQAAGPTSPTRGQATEARGTTTLQAVERRQQTQKIRQNEMREK